MYVEEYPGYVDFALLIGLPNFERDCQAFKKDELKAVYKPWAVDSHKLSTLVRTLGNATCKETIPIYFARWQVLRDHGKV